MANTKEKMLIKVSAAVNSNKFYHVVLTEDSMIIKRWGRVGSEGASATEKGNQLLFDSLVRSKIAKGYKETTITPSTTPVQHENLKDVARKVLAGDKFKGDPTLEGLIERLATANRHDILEATGGLIKVDTNGVITTPLGLVSLDSIAQAEKVLRKMKRAKGTVRVGLAEEYLTLVPQKVPSKRGWEENFLSEKTDYLKQQDLLTQLKESLKWHEAEMEAQTKALDGEVNIEEKYKDLFSFQIGLVEEHSKTFKQINRMFEKSKNSRHSGYKLKLKRVFSLESPSVDAEYNEVLQRIGNEQQLWHGTEVSNILSILRKGLFVPPLGSSNFGISGRMFGDGVYLSDISSKSLGYTDSGTWKNRGNNNAFMFLANVAMGREFTPYHFNAESLHKAHYGVDRFGKSFNSISVKGGTCNVLNNEMIVWDTKQIKLSYLCEFGI